MRAARARWWASLSATLVRPGWGCAASTGWLSGAAARRQGGTHRHYLLHACNATFCARIHGLAGVARGIGRIHGGRVYAYQADSHEKAQQRGRQEIAHLVDQLGVRPREESVESGEWMSRRAVWARAGCSGGGGEGWAP